MHTPCIWAHNMWPKLKSVAKVPCFTVQMHQTDHSSDYEHSARQRLQKRWTLTQAQLSPTRTESAVSRKVPAPYGVQRSIASHAPLVRTAPKATANTVLYRCSRPPAGTGITVSNTASEANACAFVAERRGECCLAPDRFRHVTAATVGRTARQPERRRRHVQPS